MHLILNVTFILYFVSTSFSFYFFLLHLDYSIHFLWRWLHHFCYYSTYTELSRYCFCYDVYVHYISDSRMFIVHILTWLIWNTISVHWKLLFIVLPQFTKPNVDNIANHLIATWIYSFLPLPITREQSIRSKNSKSYLSMTFATFHMSTFTHISFYQLMWPSKMGQ